MRSDALLFGESQSRIIVTTAPENNDALTEMARQRNVPIQEIGSTGGEKITIYHNREKIVDLSVEKAYTAWKQAIPDRFQRR